FLMGTQEEIEARLLTSRDPPREYEPATFRSAFRSGDDVYPARRNPLTAQQEAEIRSRSNGMCIILGCKVSGLEELEPFLVSNFGDEFVCRPSVGLNLDSFPNYLDDLGNRQRDGINVVIVPPESAWSSEWVAAAASRLIRLKSKTSYV